MIAAAEPRPQTRIMLSALRGGFNASSVHLIGFTITMLVWLVAGYASHRCVDTRTETHTIVQLHHGRFISSPGVGPELWRTCAEELHHSTPV